MKQLLFLLLFPCFAVAQYPGNAGQKITLGEQTTADGLVYRGVASIDTITSTSKITRANKQDTSAFLLLDTVTNLLWHYKTASNGWIQAGLPAQSQSTTNGATLKSNGTNTYWDNFSAAGTVQDQSGNFYNTVAIGTQVWFKENLRTKKYRNGNNIIVKTNTDISTLDGQMYYYNNDSLTNYSIYGALYNWRATQVSDSLCPVGWHVPTAAEWITLITYLGDVSVAGGKMKSIGTAYWNSPNTGATNESGFSVLPGGGRGSDGSFVNLRNYAFFWSATEDDPNNDGVIRFLNYNIGDAGRGYGYNKSVGASVRCLKN